MYREPFFVLDSESSSERQVYIGFVSSSVQTVVFGMHQEHSKNSQQILKLQ